MLIQFERQGLTSLNLAFIQLHNPTLNYSKFTTWTSGNCILSSELLYISFLPALHIISWKSLLETMEYKFVRKRRFFSLFLEIVAGYKLLIIAGTICDHSYFLFYNNYEYFYSRKNIGKNSRQNIFLLSESGCLVLCFFLSSLYCKLINKSSLPGNCEVYKKKNIKNIVWLVKKQ